MTQVPSQTFQLGVRIPIFTIRETEAGTCPRQNHKVRASDEGDVWTLKVQALAILVRPLLFCPNLLSAPRAPSPIRRSSLETKRMKLLNEKETFILVASERVGGKGA